MHSTKMHMCPKLDASKTNILGVTNINVTERKQILLPSEQFVDIVQIINMHKHSRQMQMRMIYEVSSTNTA